MDLIAFQEPHCFSRGIQQYNDGSNRLTCFLCDYDMCADCGKLEVEFNGLSEDGNSGTSGSTSRPPKMGRQSRQDSAVSRSASVYRTNAYAEGFANKRV